MHSRQEFFAKFVHCLEQGGAVNDARWQGVHLWPLYRMALMEAVGQLAYDAFAAPVEAAYRALQPQPPPDCPEEAVTPAAAAPAAGLHLFYGSREDHFLPTPEGLAAPVLDAWVDLAAESGETLKVEFASPHPAVPRARPTRPLADPPPAAVADCRRGLLADPAFRAAAAALERTAGAAAEAAAPGIGRALTVPFLDRFARLLTMKQAFDRLLDVRAPAASYVVCWYSLPQAALTWACNARGIPTAEVMHSGVPEFHHGYSHLGSVPPEGYHVLPRTFLAWDLPSANAILRWIPPASRAAHRALAAAAPHLLPGRQRRSAAGPALADALAGIPHTKRVLVGLGGDAASGLVPALADTLARAPRDWLWLVRCHPLHRSCTAPNITPDQVRAILGARGLRNYETDLATACTAAEILPLADHHLTVMSTLAFDGLACGVPTTFLGPIAPVLYGWLARHRAAHFAADPEAAVACIAGGRAGLDAERLRRLAAADGAACRRALAAAVTPPRR